MMKACAAFLFCAIAALLIPHAIGSEPIEPLLKVAPGFAVERVYIVPRDSQGSWISLAADNRGAIYASDQYGPLYQVAIAPDGHVSAQPIKLPIGGVHGMAFVGDELYAVVGQREICQPGLYRLRDTDGDGQLDDVRLLQAIGGDGEHGPHGIAASADGQSLFIVAGNAAPLPPLTSSRVPERWRDDSLLPPLPALIGSETRGLAHGGWICRTDREGQNWELICMGLRNAYAVAVDRTSELFTFDSDTEFEIGLPWYRPTRVLHCVSGADFGWRRGALKVPDGAPDTLPPLVSMGLGSPTAVLFANQAKFPARYRDALLVADWCFGRLHAVHLRGEGAGFAAQSEEILTGTPLPIAASCVNPRDGALYFVTGGRKTQSALYRLSWEREETAGDASPPVVGNEALRRRMALEVYHGRASDGAVDAAWPALASDDVWLRHAARVALEWQPVEKWQDRALAERRPQASLTALLALARCGDASLQPRLLAALEAMSWERLGGLRFDWLRVSSLTFSRLGTPLPEVRRRWIELLSPRFPSGDDVLDAALCELLVYVESPQIAKQGIARLKEVNTQERQLSFARALSTLQVGWTPELRGEFFDWIGKASALHGGASFNAFLQRICADALASVPADQRDAYRRRMEAAMPATNSAASGLPLGRPLVKHWRLEELVALAESAQSAGDARRGRQAFAAAGCAVCHSFAGEGGAIGADLTAVTRHLSTRELLEAIIDPSKEISDQYAAVVVTRRDGSQVTGRVVNFNGGAIHLWENLFDPSAVTKVPETDVASIARSKVSLMPAGLLNVLGSEEIVDLLAYLRSGGNVP